MKDVLENVNDVVYKLSFLLSKKKKTQAAVLLGMSMIGALFETLGVSAILPLVQSLINPEKLRQYTIIDSICIWFDISSPLGVVLLCVIGMIGVYIIKNGYLIFLSYSRSSFAANVRGELGDKLMRSYMTRGYQFYLTASSHKLYRGLTGDVSGVQAILDKGFQLVAEILTDVTILVFLFMTDPFIAVVLTILGLFVILITTLISKKRIKALGEESRLYDTLMKKSAQQAFDGIKEALVMKKQNYFLQEYDSNNEKMLHTTVIQNVTAASPSYFIETVCICGLLVVVCIEANVSSEIATIVPGLATVAMAAFRIMPSLGRIANYTNIIMFNVPSLNACYENVHESLKSDLSVALNNKGKTLEILKFQQEIKLNNVSFQYDNANVDVLKSMNMIIKKNTTIGIIGESGAGKSTVTDVILGLLIPQKGSVTVDGIDIRCISDSWGKIIGYVPQTVYILDESIKKNIAFGIVEPEIDEERIWHSLEEAQLKEFVMSLPEGLDTTLGERGVRLSGGQRQRIAIARALYYNPEVLVLDEATSALDNKTEEAVMEAIDYFSGRKTLIIVAHRLTTVKDCDYIYEIIDGKAYQRSTQDVLNRLNLHR